MSKVTENDTVRVHYTGKLVTGEVFDSSLEREPLEVELGQGSLIPGFERGLIDMEVNQTKTITIPKEEAYGEVQKELFQEIAKAELPSDITPEVGMGLVARGEVSAPVVIGRDHLDTGSVASPNRETEGMRDGSDAIADWPLLNAMLNTAAGASWVSIHHGGGVGIGYALHAGMVCVADGTEMADRRLQRVLTTDPGSGIARHVDAGYEEAAETARTRGVDIPMLS